MLRATPLPMKPAPVTPARAREMLQRLRIAPLLAGLRGRPAADVESACEAIARFSELAYAGARSIEEIEMNPLLVHARGCVAVDARARLARAAQEEPVP